MTENKYGCGTGKGNGNILAIVEKADREHWPPRCSLYEYGMQR